MELFHVPLCAGMPKKEKISCKKVIERQDSHPDSDDQLEQQCNLEANVTVSKVSNISPKVFNKHF